MFKAAMSGKEEDKRARLAQVRVLVADADVRTAELVRRLLYSFGFRRIFLADNGEDAMRLIRSKQVELIITESRMERKDGLTLVRTIRGLKDDPTLRRDIPIIMLTAEAEVADVQRARDVGVTEFLVKPFSAKTLSHRIIQVIDNPRVFVESKGYVGPCRRRRRPAPAGMERRKAEMKPLPDLKDTIFSGIAVVAQKLQSLAEADIYAPNTTLKAALGNAKAEEILNDNVVEEAQGELMQAEEQYIAWAREDIAKLEAAFEELERRPGDPMAHHLLLTAAYSIKAQAGIFGYDLGSEIGKRLVEYLQQNPVMDANRLVVVRKHIDTINVVFTQKIKDSGQQMARELLGSLHALICKIG